MTVEELRAAVLAVPGVLHAELGFRDDGTPVVRVWTDDSRTDAEVRTDVYDVVAIHGYGSGRLGAGRAVLQARIAETMGGTFPPFDDPTMPTLPEQPPAPPSLAKLVIEESGESVVAVASDSSGRSARAHVGEGDEAFLIAVTGAVAELRGVAPKPKLVSVEDRLVAGVDVVSVVIETAVGERYAGAAVVRGGRPFSVGRAVDAALINSL